VEDLFHEAAIGIWQTLQRYTRDSGNATYQEMVADLRIVKGPLVPEEESVELAPERVLNKVTTDEATNVWADREFGTSTRQAGPISVAWRVTKHW
jgi:hypothetical protein